MIVYFICIIAISKITLSISICRTDENYCSKCNPFTKLCVKCEREMYTPNNYGGCDIIKKCIVGNNYCLECAENSILCKKCEIGYFPDESGGCSYSTNCELSYQGKCLICKKNYVLVGIENYEYEGILLCKSINSDDFSNCASIEPLNGICQECLPDYYLNTIDNKCTKTANCSKSSFGICKECINGYYLDLKENKCKKQNEKKIFEYCKITIDGEKCSKCEDDYYFDKYGSCVGINFCEKKESYNTCEKCIKGFYLSENDKICTSTDNCFYGNKHTGICEMCKDNYYIDYQDGICKSNQEDNDYKYCKAVENNTCIQCSKNYYLENNNKCSLTKNCEISKNGICIKCKEDYYLGYDNICTDIEHCIYSEDYVCVECEDNYYYDQNNRKCELADENFANCKYNVLGGNYCERCKDDYYLNETNHLCYSNQGDFYKCAVNYIGSNNCDICMKGYYLGYKDKKCSTIEGCDISENENKCLECDEDYYCLNVKSGKCEINNEVIYENKKYLYKCNKTNEDGTSCGICLDGYILNNDGLCIDDIHCKEKKDGICLKCEEEYCLNNIFGCIEMFFDNCLECNDIFNMERCTKCEDGYEVDIFDTCTEK